MNLKRLTTDNPVGNLGRMLNNVYAKDGKAIIRLTMANDDRENIDLCEYIADLVSGVYKDGYCTAESLKEGACMDCDGCPFGVLYAACIQAAELRARLKMYEDKDEQGLLFDLPCKVGDTVYVIRHITKAECEKRGVKPSYISPSGRKLYYDEDKPRYIDKTTMKKSYYQNLNKTVFLTREEAEQALKERENK